MKEKHEDLQDKLEALARSMGPTELNRMWEMFTQQKDIRVNLQKGLLALSFGYHLLEKEDGAQHFYDAAGYIEGLNAKIEEEDSSPKNK